MNRQKNQEDASSSLLSGIQNEVSAENAPLLQLITRHAGLLAGVLTLLLLILGGMAIWNWHHQSRQKEAMDSLTRINMELKGREHDEALSSLAETAPESARMSIYMNLGKSAGDNGNPDLSAQAYAMAAKQDADGALGTAAYLAYAGSLLAQGENGRALEVLQNIAERIPLANRSAQLRQMTAEAALRAGKRDLAIKIYRDLANEIKTSDGDYFLSRANALTTENNPQDSTSANTSDKNSASKNTADTKE